MIRQRPRDFEHLSQVALINWARLSKVEYPELQMLYAIPNGGHRSRSVAGKMKAEGVLTGMPDLHLPVARGGFIGLYIEMKHGKNKPSAAQKKCISRLMALGHRVEVCYYSESAREVLIDYLYLKGRNKL